MGFILLSTLRKNRRVCSDCYEKTSRRLLKNNLHNKPSINHKKCHFENPQKYLLTHAFGYGLGISKTK